MKRTTKFFSAFLSILMLWSVIPLTTVTANALSGSSCHSAATPLTESFSELTSGYYYLNNDIDLTSRFYVDGDVTLCLNGKTLTAVNSRGAYVSGNSKLTICDCDGSGVFMTDNTYNDSDMYPCIDLAGNGSFVLQSGTVYSDSAYAVACSTKGNVLIEGGTLKGTLEGISVYTVNDISIISGEIISENYHAVSFDNATFNNFTVSGGTIEGKNSGVYFGKYTCTGQILISGGTFNGAGPVPNTTTNGGFYYGLTFSNSNGGACDVRINGGNFSGARGGMYCFNPNANIYISGGTFGSSYRTGISAQQGNFYINGGQIYGLEHSGTRSDYSLVVTMNKGELLYADITGDGTSRFSVYGGTVGKIGNDICETAIYTAHFTNKTNKNVLNIYGGTVIGSKNAVHNPNDTVLISGGSLIGEKADILLGTTTEKIADAYLSFDGYSGESVTVSVYDSCAVDTYIAKNVFRYDLISLVDSSNYANYYEKDKAVKLEQAHVHYWYKTVEEKATCTEDGLLIRYCNCREEPYTYPLGAQGHSYKSEVETPATHTDFGVMKYTCSKCEDSYTEVIEKTATHTYGTFVTEPTCTTDGYTTYTCACGDSYTADYTDAIGHSHTGVVTTPATHTAEGVMTYTCSCGDSYTEIIEKTAEHTYEPCVTEPTCTTDGYTTYTCACGDSYTADYTDAIGHSHTGVVTTPATHTAEGVMTYTCSCGDSYTEVIAKDAEHTYTSEATKEATHLIEGEIKYTCICGDTYTAPIPTLPGHTYSSEIVEEPKCKVDGTKVYYCECGHSYTESIYRLGHVDDDDNGRCDRCDVTVCDHMCHKTGFMGFIWKIVLFFSKLFGTNPVCDCGAVHY